LSDIERELAAVRARIAAAEADPKKEDAPILVILREQEAHLEGMLLRWGGSDETPHTSEAAADVASPAPLRDISAKELPGQKKPRRR
jgi:hypothetical protein